MTSDLQELFERINWARSEISQVNEELLSWVKADIILASKIEPDQPHIIQLLAHYRQPIPLGCRARSGVIVNELRSCLDGLASKLAIRNAKTPRGVYFPICDNEADFDTDPRLSGKIKKLAPEDQAIIVSTKPFAVLRSGEPGNLLIYGLHKADIMRKHIELLPCNTGTSIALKNGSVGYMYSISKNITEKPEVMAWISTGSIAEISLTPQFLYSQPEVLNGRRVIDTLHDFANEVEKVVKLFC